MHTKDGFVGIAIYDKALFKLFSVFNTHIIFECIYYLNLLADKNVEIIRF